MILFCKRCASSMGASKGCFHEMLPISASKGCFHGAPPRGAYNGGFKLVLLDTFGMNSKPHGRSRLVKKFRNFLEH